MEKFTKSENSLKFVYLTAFSLASLSDWLQGPYIYALYQSFGLSQSLNKFLFLMGYASSVLLGTFVTSFSDKFGRKKFCLLFCFLYSFACLTKHFNSFPVLIAGRLAGGVATSLLFSVFESWLVGQCHKLKFSQSFISQVLSLQMMCSSAMAILAGFLAQFLAGFFPQSSVGIFHTGGFTLPFDFACLVLLVNFLLISCFWDENFGTTDKLETSSFSEILWKTYTDKKILKIGLLSGFFEGSMYLFVFYWTPTLQRLSGTKDLSYGLIFSTFMVCCFFGGKFYKILEKFSGLVKAIKFLFLVAFLANSIVFLILFEKVELFYLALFSFFLFEFCVGIFYPSIGTLKALLVPEERRASVYGVLRIPLNLFVIVVFLKDLKNVSVFGVTALMTLAGLGVAFTVDLESEEKKQ